MLSGLPKSHLGAVFHALLCILKPAFIDSAGFGCYIAAVEETTTKKIFIFIKPFPFMFILSGILSQKQEK